MCSWVKIFSFDVASIGCFNSRNVSAVFEMIIQTLFPIALSVILFVGFKVQSKMVKRSYDKQLQDLDNGAVGQAEAYSAEDQILPLTQKRQAIVANMTKLQFNLRKANNDLAVEHILSN